MTPVFTKANWYRGNTHTHSNRSDGVKSPEEAFEWYRQHGYDFLALTDHHRYYPGGNHNGLLVIPGIEAQYHIVGLGMPSFPDETKRWSTPAEVIDDIRQHGGLAILGHPYWSHLTDSQVAACKGIVALEVYNSVCDYAIARGYSEVHWDNLLEAVDRPVFGVAADDSHWRESNEGTGWIMVNADELSTESILDAIAEGSFYATQGPQFKQITLDGDTVRAEFSPITRLEVLSNEAGQLVTSPSPITSFEYQFRGPSQKYIRFQIIDAEGKKAWSNPIYNGSAEED